MERTNKKTVKNQPVTHGKVVTTTTTTTKTTTTVVNGKSVTTTTQSVTTVGQNQNTSSSKISPSTSKKTDQTVKQTSSKIIASNSTKKQNDEQNKIDLNPSLGIQKLSLEENQNQSDIPSLIKKWRSLFQNESLTSHLAKIPDDVMGSYKSLARYLVINCSSDLEKFAMVYLWVVQNISYDVKNFFSGGNYDCSPEGVFRSRVGVCSGYSRLFTAMCEELGLVSENINGYAKGYGYVAGQKFKSTDHEWNAIKINGTYYLVDTCWGSGTVDAQQKFCRRFTPFYFMTPNEMFLNDHLPSDGKWQLLGTKISLEEFELRSKKDNETFVTAYYKNIFEPMTHFEPEILSKSNELNVKIKVPGKEILVGLRKEGKDIPGMTMVTYGGRRRLGRNHSYETNIYSINVMLPEKNIYDLIVFAKDLTAASSDNFWSIMTYRVTCTSSTKLGKKVAFPVVHNTKKNTLISPMNKYLKIGSEQVFKLKINGSQNVAVVQDGKWKDLKLSEKGTWQRTLKITHNKISVYSKGSDETAYWGVVDYEGI
jgi:hypothetical protein